MAIVGLGLLGGQASAGESPPPQTQKEKASYAMGVAVGRNIQRQGIELDADALERGLRDALAGQKLAMTDEELRSTMDVLMAEAKQKAREAAKATDRKAAGEAFRAENAKKEGVVTLASGVQYKILEAGDGQTPTDADTVACHYRGALIDGRELESSYKRGKPEKITIARTLPAWREVMKLMPVGSTWQIVVPPELGPVRRGKKARRNNVARNETLVFEIKLLSIEPRRVEAPVKAAGGSPGPATSATAGAPSADGT
jgi:FKBP-type peptidyl-prolyl cis-trans isomerase FklB